MALPSLNLQDLTPEEKLRLLEELWDSLAADPSAVPLTTPQRVELDRRLDDLERGGDLGIPWDQVLAKIQGEGR